MTSVSYESSLSKEIIKLYHLYNDQNVDLLIPWRRIWVSCRKCN